MPNLVPPVVTANDADRLSRAAPGGACRRVPTFKPLMTCYLTDDTDPDDVEAGFATVFSRR